MAKELSKIYEPDRHESAIYERWLESGKFDPDKLDLNADAPSYTIVLPPPNVTGTLHLGHAAMLAYEDILIRYHRMRGYRTLWLPGTDHAAIATQTKVEKLMKPEGHTRHSLGREAFLERVGQFARESHDTIVGQLKRMGSSLDWSREAYTLDETRNKAVVSVFKLMYDDGLIYRGERVVNWCPRCHSTLADDEVEYKQQRAPLYTFRYAKNFPFAIATTRPETKLGDTAVAVNPSDERYRAYVGKTFMLDFVGIPLTIKVIADRSVDAAFGTGALGVTPAHSHVDAQMAEANGLAVVKVIDEDGKIHPGFTDYSGQSASEARALIVERLHAAGLMEKEEEVENNLSLCYRCDTPVEPLPSLQWFIDVNKPITRNTQHATPNKDFATRNSQLATQEQGSSNRTSNIEHRTSIDWEGKTIKDVCLEVVKEGKIKIYPERFEKNYYNWMDSLRPWCISRQIWFGHRIPVWYCSNYELRITNYESGNPCTQPIVAITPPDICPHCGGAVRQDEDTLDTWFSSGLWTFSTLANSPDQIRIEDGKLVIDTEDFRRFHPTAVLETGYDILFFWVARMIIMTTYAVGEVPFRDVYLHGLVLDEKGKKMSKSKGNVIDPVDMCDRYGTDATRLALVIGAAPGADLRLGEEKIAGYRNFVNKLWNVARFAITNYELRITSDNSTAGDGVTGLPRRSTEYGLAPRNDSFTLADKWIMDKLDRLIVDVTEDLKNYRFSQAGERLRTFTWDDLADWYLEASKFEAHEGKAALLGHILETILKLWHPFIPFVTEAIWSEMGKEELLMAEKWPEQGVGGREQGVGGGDFEMIKGIVVAIRNARSENRIEPGRKVDAVVSAGSARELFESQRALITGLRTGIGTLDIVEKGDKIEDAIYVSVGGIDIYLLGGVDKDKEKARLEKEIARLGGAIETLKSRLDNAEFTAKAPAAVVEKEQARLEAMRAEREKSMAQLESL